MAPYVVLFVLPDGWERFDLWESNAAETVSRRLEERLSEQGVDSAARDALRRAARATVDQARQTGMLVWAVQLPVRNSAGPATLTVGLSEIPDGPPTADTPMFEAAGDTGGYISQPSEPRPLELVFDDSVGLIREWKLRVEPVGPDAASLFCAQAVIVSQSRQVAATVNVSAFEPADEDEIRRVAAEVGRSLRLAPLPGSAD